MTGEGSATGPCVCLRAYRGQRCEEALVRRSAPGLGLTSGASRGACLVATITRVITGASST